MLSDASPLLQISPSTLSMLAYTMIGCVFVALVAVGVVLYSVNFGVGLAKMTCASAVRIASDLSICIATSCSLSLCVRARARAHACVLCVLEKISNNRRNIHQTKDAAN